MRAALLGGRRRQEPDLIKQASTLRDWYPEFTGGGSPYELLAKAYVGEGKKPEAVDGTGEVSRNGRERTSRR